MPTLNNDNRTFLTVNDLIESGYASRSTIWRRIRSGVIPSYKVGKSVLIPRDEFLASLEDFRQIVKA